MNTPIRDRCMSGGRMAGGLFTAVRQRVSCSTEEWVYMLAYNEIRQRVNEQLGVRRLSGDRVEEWGQGEWKQS